MNSFCILLVLWLTVASSRRARVRQKQSDSELQIFRKSLRHGLVKIAGVKLQHKNVRSSQGISLREDFERQYKSRLYEAANETFHLISSTVKNKTSNALSRIFRKVVRRTNERSIPAYYVDRIDRDYFTDYFAEIYDLGVYDDDEDHLEENLESSLITDVEREGLLSAYAFSTATTVLEELVRDENTTSFAYEDDCNQSGKCAFTARAEVGAAENFRGRDYAVNGATFSLDPRLASQSTKLEIYITSSRTNPYSFDPSLKFTGPVVSIGLRDPSIDLFVSLSQTVGLQIPLDLNVFEDTFGGHILTTQAKPLLQVADEDIPALKMQLLPNATVTLQIITVIPNMELYVVVTEEFRPSPVDFCKAETRVLKPAPNATNGLFSYPATSFKSRPGQSEEDLRDYFVGIYPKLDSSPALTPNATVNFSAAVYRINCVFRDEDRHVWSEQGCQVNDVNETHVNCTCPHLSTFTATQLVTPTSLEIPDSSTFAVKLEQNYVISISVGSLLLLYILLLILCKKLDWRDEEVSGLHLMVDPAEGVPTYYFLLTAYSGGLLKPFWAQPTSNISIQLYGCGGTSWPYVLREEGRDPGGKLLRNNGVDTFLLSSPKHLGKLEKVRLWRDNNGSYPDWYCRKILVHCLTSKRIYHFFVNRVLSAGYFGYATTYDVVAATESEILSWNRRFLENVYDDFSEEHTWLSAIQRRPGTLFTRTQRLTCAVSTLFSKLILTFMFVGVFEESEAIEVGEFSIQIQELIIALQIFFLQLPFQLFLHFIFKRSKPGLIPTIVVWSASKSHEFHNVQIFGHTLPGQSPTHAELIPTYVPRKELKMMEIKDKFSIPSTDTPDTERWLCTTERGAHHVISYRKPEPDDYIRSFQDRGDSADDSAAATAATERSEEIQRLRHKLPQSFTFSAKDGPLEELIDEEIYRNEHWSKKTVGVSDAERSQHRKSKQRVQDGPKDSQQLDERLSQLGLKIPPVKVVQVVGDSKEQETFTHVAVGLQPPVRRPFCTFPRCFVAVGWGAGVGLILGSAVIAMLYGVQVGPIGSRRIISNLIITILISAFIIQPLMILILAGVKTWISPSGGRILDEERFQVIHADQKPSSQELKPCRFDLLKPERYHPPLTEVESFNLKIRSLEIHHRRWNLFKLLLHILLMLLLIAVAYSNFSRHDYMAVRNIKKALRVDTEWSDISNTSEFYKYMHSILEDMIYPRTYSDGVPIPYFEEAPVFFRDEASLLMGVPRLHQWRIHPDSVCSKSRTPYCSSEAFIEYETRDFGPRWLPLSRAASSVFPKNNAWKYEENGGSFPQLGLMRTYPGGGYFAYLGRNFIRSFSVLHYLERTNWLDGKTRGIFLEISIYNANVNLFLYTKLMAEISGAGRWFMSSITLPITLTNPDTYAVEGDDTVLHLVILFALILLLLLVKIFLVVYERSVYKVWATSEMVLVGLSFGSIVVAWHRLNLVLKVKERIDRTVVNDHIPLDEVAFWDQWQQNLFAITFSAAVLMIWEFLLAAKKEFHMMNLCLRLTRGLLLGQAVILAVLLTSFSMCGYVLFNESSVGFHSLWSAVISLLHETTSEFILDEVMELHPIWGEIFHLIYTFTIVIVGINLVVALLSKGFEDAKRIANHRTYWISYLSFLWDPCLFLKEAPLRPYPLVHPQRLQGMQERTRKFLQASLETKELKRMAMMMKLVNERLSGTGMTLVSRRRRSLRVPEHFENRLELMRRLSLRLFNVKLCRNITAEEVKIYMGFTHKILQLKLKKLERGMERMGDLIDFGRLERQGYGGERFRNF